MKKYMILFHALAFLAGYTAIDNYNKKNTGMLKVMIFIIQIKILMQ